MIARGVVFESRGELYLSMVDSKSDGVLRCINQSTKKLTIRNSHEIDRVFLLKKVRSY